jgi:pimeloyl-ACP methyl ester carboxylesterase
VSGNLQWRSLTEALKERYRVLAVNLFGYGDTTPWPENAVQTLADHADLVLALCSNSRGPVFIVGHSFGGSVALKAALRLGHKVAGLVLLEPNPFYLLSQHKRHAAYEEIKAFWSCMRPIPNGRFGKLSSYLLMLVRTGPLGR